jgi:hypothetical protein
VPSHLLRPRGELRGLEWPDYTGEAIGVNRSVWKGVVNRPQTRTSRQPVPVIPKLANLLDEHRASMGDPTTGAMFHNGSGESMDMDKLAQRVIRPESKPSGYAGLAGTVSAAGSPPIFISWAQTKRSCSGFSVTPSHTSPKTVTCYIKAFDPAVLEAMQWMQATVDVLEKSPAVVQQMN